MKIKSYQCDCEHVIFPFGKYAPVCLRKMEQTKDHKDLRQCIRKGCPYYKTMKRSG